MRIVGLISGTSMDGIDAAVAQVDHKDGEIELQPLGSITFPYETQLRNELGAVLPPATTTAEAVCHLDNEVGRAFGRAAKRALDELADGKADLVVSHGQTLYHQVERGRVLGTLQIGQPAWIAKATGLPVVADLRTRDIAVGGQGAPLASMFDVLLLAGSDRPMGALNIGGIANLTIVSPGAKPVGFDIGPGNALIDAAVSQVTGGVEAFDRDGLMARRGHVHSTLLHHLHADSYYRQPPPKTTGKERFHLSYLLQALEQIGVLAPEDLAPEDLVATVTALTALTIGEACQAYSVTELIASGGGTSNPVLMEMLAAQLPSVTISSIDDLGIPSGAKEAYVFALLGFLTVHQLPGNVPSVTGAAEPAILGCVLPGRDGFPTASPIGVPPTRLRIVSSGLT